jgi:hypothetical protein
MIIFSFTSLQAVMFKSLVLNQCTTEYLFRHHFSYDLKFSWRWLWTGDNRLSKTVQTLRTQIEFQIARNLSVIKLKTKQNTPSWQPQCTVLHEHNCPSVGVLKSILLPALFCYKIHGSNLLKRSWMIINRLRGVTSSFLIFIYSRFNSSVISRLVHCGKLNTKNYVNTGGPRTNIHALRGIRPAIQWTSAQGPRLRPDGHRIG